MNGLYRPGYCPGKLVAARLVLVVPILAGAGLRAGPAGAMPYEDLLGMSLEQLLEVEVVSASRQPLKTGQLSVPVSVVTSEDIHSSGLTNLPEVLQFVPGVDVLRCDRNHYAVSVRGLHEVWSDRTLVLIDGRNANSPLFGGADWQQLPILLPDIERVEVVRGPGGAAWGANAFNGAVNIITKDPKDCRGWTVSTTLSQFRDNYTHVRWASQAGGWSWRTSLGYEDRVSSADAISARYQLDRPDLEWLFPQPFAGFQVRDFGRDWRSDNKVVWEVSEQTTWSAGLAAGHFEEGDFEILGYYPQKDHRQDSIRVFARLDHDFSSQVQGYLQWFNNYDDSYRPSLLRYSAMEDDLEGQLDLIIGDRKLSVGANVRFIRIDSELTEPNDFAIVGGPLHERWIGLFVMDRWEVTDHLALEGQYRWDDYTQTHSDWSCRLSALYSMDGQGRNVLRLSGARAYRAPLGSLRRFMLQRLEIPILPGIYAINMNPSELVNEETWSLEAGYTSRLTDHVLVRIDGYCQRYQDLIGYKDTPNPWAVIITQARNVDGARALGAECELVWEHRWGTISAWYARNEFEPDRSYQELRAYHPARDKAGLTARAFVGGGAVVNLNYRYTSRTRFASDQTVKPTLVEGTHRLDLTISSQFAGPQGEFMVGIADLLDQSEQKVIALGHLASHVTPGRTFFARMVWRQ